MQKENRPRNKSKTQKKKKHKKRLLFWFLILLFLLVLLTLLFLPSLISSKKGNQIILAQINKYINGTADFSSLSMSWRKGIQVTDLKFSDDVGRLLLNVKKLQTKPHYFSLLTTAPSFGQTTIDEPDVNINLINASAKKTKALPKKPAGSKKTILPVKKIALAVNNGNLKVTDPQGQKTSISRINSRLNLKPAGQQTSFDIDMNLSNKDKKSKIIAQGQVTPKKETGWSLEGTSGNLTIEFNDLDIESLGPFFALAGIDVNVKGTASANLYTEIKDGQVEKFDGSINTDNLHVTGPIIKGDRIQTDTLDINVKLARQQKMINIENLAIDTDWLKAQVTGTVPTTFESLGKFLNSDSDLQANFDCQLGTILSQMPGTFGIKEGIQITSGSLKGDVKTSTQAGKRNIAGQASLTGLAGIVDGKNISISQPVAITAQIAADDQMIRLDNLDVSAAFAQLNCSGTGKELKYTADADLSKLQTELGQFFDFNDYKIAGNISEQGIVTFDKDKIGFAGFSEIKEFSITSKNITASEPKADITFDMEFRENEGILSISSINTNAAFGKVSITDSIVAINKDADKQSKINVTADSLDLEKLRPFAVIFASLPEETKLAGLADSDILIAKKNDTYEFKTDNTKIRKLKIGYPGRKDFEQDEALLVANGKVNLKDKTYTVKARLTGLINIRGDYESSLDGNTRNIKGQADLEYDWSSVNTMAGAFLPKDLEIEGQRKDTIAFSSKYPADKPDLLFANLNADIKTGFDKAKYAGVYLGKTEPQVKIEKGLLKIEPFTTTANNGKLNFSAKADLKTKPVLLTTTGPMKIIENFEINDEIAKKYLLYFNPIFSNAFNVSGKTSLHCETLIVPIYAGENKDIDIVGTFSVDHLRLQASEKGLLGQLYSLMDRTAPSQNITVRPTKFTLKNGLLKYDDMQVDIGDNPFNFKGTIGLNKSLNMTVILPYTLKGTTARVDKKTVGKRIELPLKGTIDNPQLDTGKLFENQLKNLLEDQLQQILKDKMKLDTKKENNQNQTDGQLKETIEDIIRNQLGELLKEKN